jgi:hypothetical protein
MLVLSGVFNTRIMVATNYANQDYMCVNYTIVVYTIPLVTCCQSKNVSYQRLVNPCSLPSIGQTWVLASNDAVFEMGNLIRAI